MKRLPNILASLTFALALAGAAHAQAVKGLDGRWEGPVTSTTGATITTVFRVETEGGLTIAMMDSPNQGAKDIPATVKRNGDTVTFEVPAASLVYTAKLAADGKSMSGDMAQGGGAVPVTLKLTAQAVAAAKVLGPVVKGLDGRWEGAITADGTTLHGVFRISTTAAGTETLMDSPDQNGFGFTGVTTLTGRKVVMDITSVGGDFTGELSADGKTITAAWNQNGQAFPLVVTKK